MIQNALADCIAALATPRGRGALAIVRLSGEHALDLADRVFRGRKPLNALEGYQGAHGVIEDGEDRIDEVVAWVYRAPHTYTGEDLVEFTCHGGPGLAERILETLWRHGARPAGPGEFTRRAFLNRRLDLTQAEAVADLIAARGVRAQTQALHQLEGGLSRRVHRLAQGVRDVLARITVYLDFDEDVPEVPDTGALLGTLRASREGLHALLSQHSPSRRVREGLRVALVGRPNVGKSSLLNSLLGADRALVHEEPGTTRDVVDAHAEWEGLAVRLFDTAGHREGLHPVERAGIDRSRAVAGEADIVLWVIDGSEEPAAEDRELGRSLKELTQVVLYVAANKEDLGLTDLGWVSVYSPREVFGISALTGMGLDALKHGLVAEGLREAPEDETYEGVNERHAFLLKEAVAGLDRGIEALEAGRPAELAAADLSRCLDSVGEILGDKAGPELLDTIFSRFCIGK